MKHLRILISVFILSSSLFFISTNFASANITKCVGEPITLNWSSSNVSGCTLNPATSNPSYCSFAPVKEATQNRQITGLTSGFCTNTLSCSGASKTDTVTIDTTKTWNGSSCVAVAVPVNCVGSWNNNGTCSVSGACGQTGVYQQTYTITTPSSNGGVACNYANGATRWGSTSCSTAACASTNNASCSGISAPASVTAGQAFSASITMSNTGNTTWTSASSYLLGSQSPQDNYTWGTNRVALPYTTGPGSSATFTRTFTAPSTPGTYPLSWEMLREGVAWFGSMCSQNITVAAMTGTLTSSSATCSIPTGGSSCNVNLTWNTSNPVGTSAVTRNNPAGTVFNGNSGSAQSVSVSGAYANVTYYLYNNGGLLAQTTVTPSCATGNTWNGSVCSLNTFNITSSAGTGGTISPNGTTAVGYNGSQVYNITTLAGYTLASVTTDGVNRGAVASYTFSNVQASHNIVATFTLNACGNGANNPPSCNTCTAPQVWNTSSLSCNGPIGIVVNPTSYSTILPNNTISATYTLGNANSSNTTCRLLDNAGTPLTAYSPCTGSLSVSTPTTPSGGTYGYSIRAFKSQTNETVTSNSFTVTVGPAPIPGCMLSGANNYNPSATVSDGSCCYGWDSWNGSSCVTPPPQISTFTSEPRTSSSLTAITGVTSVISWDIKYPNSTCNISATTICTGGHSSCTASQLTAETNLNNALRSPSTTDNNDIYGASRSMTNALQTTTTTSTTNAKGKKTVQIYYTTDFNLQCGSASKKIRFLVTTNNEG